MVQTPTESFGNFAWDKHVANIWTICHCYYKSHNNTHKTNKQNNLVFALSAILFG